MYYFKKSNNGVFQNGLPVTRTQCVREVYLNKKLEHINLDGVIYKNLIQINEEEYRDILMFWNSLSTSKPSLDPTWHCVSELSGKPKVKVSNSKLREVLYKQKIKIPDIEAYICPKCGNYHLGKKKV